MDKCTIKIKTEDDCFVEDSVDLAIYYIRNGTPKDRVEITNTETGEVLFEYYGGNVAYVNGEFAKKIIKYAKKYWFTYWQINSNMI